MVALRLGTQPASHEWTKVQDQHNFSQSSNNLPSANDFVLPLRCLADRFEPTLTDARHARHLVDAFNGGTVVGTDQGMRTDTAVWAVRRGISFAKENECVLMEESRLTVEIGVEVKAL